RHRLRPGRTSTRRPLYAALGALVLLGGAYAALRSPGPADRAAVAQAPAPATRPAEAKPPARTDEAKTGDKTGDTKAADPKPSDTRSAEARPGEARSEAKSEARSGAKREPGETGAVEGPVAGVAEVVDTATLRLGGRTLRLSGVEAARGAQASDLSGYLAGRPVNCQPNPGRSAWICTVDGHDLSEVVLYNGGGRATPEATPDLVDAERHARTARLGIWARP
ncbi:thermonuclease family protein, partial [Methylobacterium platani]|uniref:thermonuclease family protein n=1 Tax=Methylobacterium indicum TaxID=1775910 RepID=UPI00065358D0